MERKCLLTGKCPAGNSTDVKDDMISERKPMQKFRNGREQVKKTWVPGHNRD